MKYKKNKKGLYAYSGTDSEAIQFLNAFKGVFGIDLLPYLNNKPIDFGDLLRTFDEDGTSNLNKFTGNEGEQNLKIQIDNGNLPLITSINGKVGSLIGYIYELKNWYTNKLVNGKVVLMPAEGFGMQYKEPFYMYIANKIYTPAQKLSMFETQFKIDYLLTGGIAVDKSPASITAWENIINQGANINEDKYYKGFYNDYMAWYKNKRLMAASQGSTRGSAGTGETAQEGSANNTATDRKQTDGEMTETEALIFLHEIEKFSPLNWGGLKYWYKNLMAKKKEVSKEVFNFAYDYWLRKLNAEYLTFDNVKQEKEKPDYDLINGYIFEKPKAKVKVKKQNLLSVILKALFKKK